MPSEAILSVGLECSPAQQDIGVYWSLPLSHFRYYGPAKTAAHSLCADAERVSFDHFRFVVLGSFLSTWNGRHLPKLELADCTKLIVDLFNYLTAELENDNAGITDSASHVTMTLLKSKSNWLKDLAETCNLLLDAKNTEKVVYERLIGLGIRRGAKFLANQAPLFGLTSFNEFFDMLIGTEAKIMSIRKLAAHYDVSDLSPLIRYRNPDYDREGNRLRKSSVTTDDKTAALLEKAREQTRLELAESPQEHQSNQLSERPRSNTPSPDDEVSIKHPKADQEAAFAEFSTIDFLGEYQDQKSEAIQETSLHGLFLSDFLDEYEEHESGSHQNLLYDDLKTKFEEDTERTGMEQKEETTGKDMAQADLNPSWERHNLYNLFENEIDEDLSSINATIVDGRYKRLPARYYIYASVIPFERSSTKRSWEGTEIRHVPHCRWISAGGQEQLSETHADENILNTNELELRNSHDTAIQTETSVPLAISLGDPKECALFTLDKSSVLTTPLEVLSWAVESGVIDRMKLANFLFAGNSRLLTTRQTGRQHLERSALTVIMDTYAQFPKATVALKVIDRPLRQQLWVKHLSPRRSEEYDSESEPGSDIDADSEIDNQSQSGSEYSVDPQDKEKHEQSTFRKISDLLSLTPKRSGYFALLATFETGTLNPDPLALDKVMAMSSGDSIFVATHLLVDPWDSQSLGPSSICRIRGNIGRPGVAMMVPPPELQTRPRDSTNWQVINHAPFDGEICDSFSGTSLHLSFTEYNRPVTGVHGVRDADFCFVEAYVQVRFRGKWIGDIDIISGLESKLFQIYDPQKIEVHKPSCSHTAQNLRAFRVIAIDNWDEFIDSPKDGILVRAKDNWLARLAAANLSVQRQFKTIILRPSHPVCWPCIRDHFLLGSSAGNVTFIC